MRVQPQHKQGAFLRLRMAHRAQDGAGGKRMIAAHDDRGTVLQGGLGGLGQTVSPGDGFLKRVQFRVLAGREGRRRDIATVCDAMAQIGQRARQPCGAIGIGAHQTAQPALAAIQRGPKKNTVLSRHG